MSWIIWLDEDGKEVKRKRKGRGRGPRNFVKSESDGNWYFHPPWSQPKSDDGGDGEVVVKEQPKPKKVRVVEAHKQTTSDAIIQACHSMRVNTENSLTTLDIPVVMKKTGLLEIDSFSGQPLFHKIEIDRATGSVSICDVTSPAGPFLVIEKALSDMTGDSDAGTEATDKPSE